MRLKLILLALCLVTGCKIVINSCETDADCNANESCLALGICAEKSNEPPDDPPTDPCNNACTVGQECNVATGVCACDPLYDPGVPTGWPTFTPYAHNPVMLPSGTNQGAPNGNIYASDIMKIGDVYHMWYGGQGTDGHDQIFYAWSKMLGSWQKYPTGTAPQPALTYGSSVHVNDPSVVYSPHTGKYHMYYTDAELGMGDRVRLAQGDNLRSFTKVPGNILDIGPADSWEANFVSRPSVMLENGVYKMWYDGYKTGAGRHVGYATSTDGLTFTKYAGNPVFLNAGAVDVKKVGGLYVLLHESQNGTRWAVSPDGICWKDKGELFAKSGNAYDAFGHVTPFLLVENDAPKAIFFGSASAQTWNKNRVSVAMPDTTTPVGGGCSSCLTNGKTCTEACADGTSVNQGVCGNPGSTNTGACCACSNDGCETCTGSGNPSCASICINQGHSGGFCGAPGSTDPLMCCSCFD